LDFLAGSTLAALSPALATATPSPAPSPTPSMPPLNFDLAAFDAALQTKAAHRHMFASVKLSSGQVLDTMRGVIDAYKEVGVSSGDVQTAAVLYHGAAVTLAFDDSMWNRYFIPMHAKAPKDHVELITDFNTVYEAQKKGNPLLHKSGDPDDSSVETLVTYGARFFVCNRATQGFAQYIAHQMNQKPVAVYNDLAAHLVSNATLVPAGVWAVHAIQERHYTYEQVNL
jgi:intracellular sulfur oxidation DsrE/DsrF family protein